MRVRVVYEYGIWHGVITVVKEYLFLHACGAGTHAVGRRASHPWLCTGGVMPDAAGWHVLMGEGFGYEITHDHNSLLYMFFGG